MKISYLEIYNDNGYDLLDARCETKNRLEELPRISVFEDTEAGTIHLKNLSLHLAANIDEALNLLFLGDTNRVIAETPMNEASTRSHCIFTIHLTVRTTGSSKLRRSKLHLVDLAGSERVYKSGIDGTILAEAKYINLSLHYLEQVIVALSEKQRSHVPYRNSMMTLVLRDSLGGNCMTSMIATCSVEQRNLQETISTCRFAQRVALIKNDVVLNEEHDPQLIINRLKQEVNRLKAELALATGVEREDELTEEEKESCELIVRRFISSDQSDGSEKNIPLQVLSDMRKIQFCFSVLQKMHREEIEELKASAMKAAPIAVLPPLPISTKEADELREVLKQRDHEIHVLVDLLKKEKAKHGAPANCPDENSLHKTNNHVHADHNGEIDGRNNLLALQTKQAADRVTEWLEEEAKERLLGSLSVGRAEAFEHFKKEYRFRERIDEQKEELRTLYADAKLWGKRMLQAREEANRLASRLNTLIQHGREVESMDVTPDDKESEEVRRALESKRSEYSAAYLTLKELRPRIEHLQHVLENAKVKLVKAFDEWWERRCRDHTKSQAPSTTNTSSITSPVRDAIAREDEQQTHSTQQEEEVEGKPISGEETTFMYSNTNPGVGQPSRFTYGERIPLTGDPIVDADIITFVRAREKIRRQQMELWEKSKQTVQH
ncbi:unnamed protein product [Dicrocoelium dendriticum]|nr:unnamed protein product [Dicrocoelium dendriticum]